MEEFSKDGELIVKGPKMPKRAKGATKGQKAIGLKVGLLQRMTLLHSITNNFPLRGGGLGWGLRVGLSSLNPLLS